MMKTAQKGFTLVELAIVIVIVAVLAAVAVPKFSNVTRSAQAAVVKDMVANIASASSIYTADRQATPRNFREFVKVTPLANGDRQTISLASVGNSQATCNDPPGVTIVCSGGAPGTKFPELPGNVTVSMIDPSQGAVGGNIQVTCAGGPTAPPGWNPATCSVAN